MKNIWLVEICVKRCIDVPNGLPRLFGYEEVEALDEFGARLAGFAQFVRLARFVPVHKRKLINYGLGLNDFCAPSAIVIE